ncbi:MFS transporter [Cedecea davisae]|uniref:MFS transporter n=1 Tax=Cedecea davisae TaxID=158484 RepID=UPI00242BFB73|nr:MFS transporter [Cedecea davisae]
MMKELISHSLTQAIGATRKAFFIAGLTLAAWAPLIPLARDRMMADNGTMGLVLLAFGLGSLLMMPLSGILAARFGCRLIFTVATGLVLVTLPALVLADTPFSLATFLFIFGAGIGAMDVVVNIHAVQVEKLAERPIMSGFHALFSIGAIVGSSIVSLLLSYGLTPLLTVSLLIAGVLLLLLRTACRLLREPESADAPLFVLPKGIVILLGFLCFIAYIMEGAMLDWSGILLTSENHLAAQHAGIGYILFACAMTAGRLSGDRLIKVFGRFRVFLFSSLIATLGYGCAIVGGHLMIMLAGFFLIGCGLSNLVPILFTAAGRQQVMPGALAVAAISSIGYSGILLGPALIGGVAHLYSLVDAFTLVTILSLCLPLYSHIIRQR